MIEHRVHAAVGVEPVQGAGAATLVDGHRAGPEAATRIALAVVHALVRTVGFNVSNPAREARAGIEADEAIVHGEQQIAGAGEGDGTHQRADPKRARRPSFGIVAMHEAELDVDEVETRCDRIPDWTFAQLGLGVEHALHDQVANMIPRPQSAASDAPVIAEASSDATNATTLAISAGAAIRRSG